MSESKSHPFRPPLYHRDTEREGAVPNEQADGERTREPQGREKQGWDAYRKWLSSVNGRERSRRAPIDHSIYSWKGYHSWADRVRQSWKSEDS